MQIIKNFLDKHNITDTHIALGVSGGADSLALALMFKQDFPEYNLTALTVDHQLRPSSRKEAEYVAEIMKQHHINHHILTWKGDKPLTGIEEQARVARYQLLCDWCKQNNVSNLAIAHHLYDQAETFLMRLQRGSGLLGLSCMNEISEKNGITILRPFLYTSPDILKNFLKSQNISWVEDESNQCDDFLRVKMRKILPILEEKTGLTPDKICSAIKNLQHVRDFILDEVENIISSKGHNWENLAYSFDYSYFSSLHRELRFMLLGKILTNLGQLSYMPEADSLNLLLDNLEKDTFSSATLGNCYLLKDDLKLWIIRELRSNNSLYTNSDWEKYVAETPAVRGIKIPFKLREALLTKKLS